MTETLLTGSTIWLFGRVMKDIELVKNFDRKPGPRGNLLAAALAAEDARLARIYAFGFQSEIMVLTKPAAFLVHGDGQRAKPGKCLLREGITGIPNNLKVWPYDRGDMTLRLDIMTGTFDSLLLEYEIGRDGLHDYVRGGRDVGAPTAARPASFRGGRRWRSDDD
jgi:hypothetical protein